MPGVRARRAFTLVEVLCAVALLSIGLLAVLSAGKASRETQLRAHNLALGRGIAQSKIEDLRAAAFSSLSSLAATSADSSLPSGNQIVTTVSRYPDASENNLCQATVTVTWPEGKGTRTIRYDTLIARK